MRISDWSSDVCSSDLTRSLDEQIKGIKQLVAEHELRIRNGMLAYERLQVLRSGDKSAEAIAAFNEVKQDLGYGLLLKKYTADEIGRASCRERVCQYV